MEAAGVNEGGGGGFGEERSRKGRKVKKVGNI